MLRAGRCLRRPPPHGSDLSAAQPWAQRIDTRIGLGDRFLLGRAYRQELARRDGFPGPQISATYESASAPDDSALLDALVE